MISARFFLRKRRRSLSSCSPASGTGSLMRSRLVCLWSLAMGPGTRGAGTSERLFILRLEGLLLLFLYARVEGEFVNPNLQPSRIFPLSQCSQEKHIVNVRHYIHSHKTLQILTLTF